MVSIAYGRLVPSEPVVVNSLGHCTLPPLMRCAANACRPVRCRGRIAVLDPGSVEHLHVAEAIGKNHAVAVAIEAAIDERLRGLCGGGNSEHRADRRDAVHESEAAIGEANETALPEGFDLERVGIEASRHLAIFVTASRTQTARGTVSLPVRNTPHCREPRSVWFQRSSFQTLSFWLPQWPYLPPSRSGHSGKQQRQGRCVLKMDRLAGVEIVDVDRG